MTGVPRYDTEVCHCGEPARVLILDDHGHVVGAHCRQHVTITADLAASCWVMRLEAA